MSSLAVLKDRQRLYSRGDVADGSIEAGLICLRAWSHEHPNVELNSREIAYVCGCHHNAIDQIERRALKKLRRFAPQLL